MIASSALLTTSLDLGDECACSLQVMVPLQEAWCLGQGSDTEAGVPPAREATILRTWQEYIELAGLARLPGKPAGQTSGRRSSLPIPTGRDRIPLPLPKRPGLCGSTVG